jgi:UDP-2-acetamido-3-amino-2,3-dideoxy-glucuronate N-acetyltransferase
VTLNFCKDGVTEFRTRLLAILGHSTYRRLSTKKMHNGEGKKNADSHTVANWVSESARIGKNVKIWHFAYIGDETKIGDNVMIGSLTHVDYKVSIGENTRIEGSVYVPPLTVIGKNVFIGPGATFTNDPYPMSPKMSGVVVSDGAIVGGGALIRAGVVIGNNAVVAMGSVVTKDVPADTVVMGNPARVRYSRSDYNKKQQAWNS